MALFALVLIWVTWSDPAAFFLTDTAFQSVFWERSGSVVECLTQDRGATSSSLTGITVLWSLSKTHLS